MGIQSAIVLALITVSYDQPSTPIRDDLITATGVAYEMYIVRWWGAPDSEMMRPVYRVARIDTGALQLHHGIVPGRDLINYTMPYWNIRSYISFVDAPMELAPDIEMSYRDGSAAESSGFIPRSGIELAPWDNALAVRLVNRSVTVPEDVTLADSQADEEVVPLSLEKVFVFRKGALAVPVHCTFTNDGGRDLHDVTLSLTFEQSFAWSAFGVARDERYESISAPASGAGRAFYAYSEGRGGGFAIAVDEGIELSYELENEMNRWRVVLSRTYETLTTAAPETFSYTVRSLDSAPEVVAAYPERPDLDALEFGRIQPSTFKVAPINPARRVTIDDALADVARPKVRGLNLYGSFPGVLDDLEVARDWGGNLVIRRLGEPSQTAAYVERAHALGMEVLVSGQGNFDQGAPQFDAYFEESRTAAALPDGFGQDEDHHYWKGIHPSVVFEDRFGKPMALATQDEMVAYWATCFVDKWRGVQRALEPHGSDANVWFYAPVPSVAHYDPLDSYDLFLRTLSKGLGNALTVFPFYYGIEYNQIEYMMRRWKDAGAHRVVFLPMRNFLTKPSQYIRGITAARRGGADGTCGFGFSIDEFPPEKQWQWKSVMLGAWANFPTPELDAYCLMEEPAELVEALAERDLRVRIVDEAPGFDSANRLATFMKALPHAQHCSESQTLTLVVSNRRDDRAAVPETLWEQGKGFISMHGRTVRLSGRDAAALQESLNLLLRFAELAREESNRTDGTANP